MTEEVQDTKLNKLKAQMRLYEEEARLWSVNEDGSHNPIKYQRKIMDLVLAEDAAHPEFKRGGYFLLPNAFDQSPQYDNRLSMMLLGAEGMSGTVTVPDPKEDNAFKRNKDQKINLAVMNNYPAIFRVYGDQVGGAMIDSQKNLIEYGLSQKGYKGINYFDKALEETMNLLYGDYILHKNGGFTNPNGIGTVYRRSKMKEYGLDTNFDIIENNQFNTWYRAHNVHGKELRFFLDDEFRRRNPNLSSSTVDAIVEGIFNNNGNIWIATINDLTNGGYRNVLVAQRGDPSVDREDAGYYMHYSPYQANPNVEILANLMVKKSDDVNAAWEPLNISEDEQMLSFAEAEASEHLDAHMDPWDQWTFFFNQTKKTVSMFGIENPWPISLLPYIPSSNFWSNMKLMMEDMGLMTPGRDMSRKRVKHYIDKFGPGSELYGSDEQQGLASNLLGLGRDISDPKQVDMDLVWIPIWDMIQDWEAAQRRAGQNIEAPDPIIAAFFNQRRREMFTGRVGTKERRVFSVYDAIQFKPYDHPHKQFPSTYFHYTPPPGEDL